MFILSLEFAPLQIDSFSSIRNVSEDRKIRWNFSVRDRFVIAIDRPLLQVFQVQQGRISGKGREIRMQVKGVLTKKFQLHELYRTNFSFIDLPVAQLEERRPAKAEVMGSNPI